MDHDVHAELLRRHDKIRLHKLGIAYPRDRGRDTGFLGQLARDKVYLLVVGHGRHDVDIGQLRLLQCLKAGPVPVDHQGVQLLARPANLARVGLDDGDVVLFLGQTLAQLEANVPGSDDEDFHRKLPPPRLNTGAFKVGGYSNIRVKCRELWPLAVVAGPAGLLPPREPYRV